MGQLDNLTRKQIRQVKEKVNRSSDLVENKDHLTPLGFRLIHASNIGVPVQNKPCVIFHYAIFWELHSLGETLNP